MGAMGVLTKPIKTKETLDETFAAVKRNLEPHIHRVLVASADETQRQEVAELIAWTDTELVMAESGPAAMEAAEECQV